MNFDKINPKFIMWFSQQSPEAREDIEAAWEITGRHTDLNPEASIYARQHRTLEYCAEKHGYDFT